MKVCDIMSKWSEALELAKAGFKAGEIREMWEDKDVQPEPEPEQKPVEEKKEEPKPEPVEEKQEEPEQEEDLKYIELEKKYNELLKETQKNNTMKDISKDNDQKTIEEQGYEVLANIWRN